MCARRLNYRKRILIDFGSVNIGLMYVPESFFYLFISR